VESGHASRLLARPLPLWRRLVKSFLPHAADTISSAATVSRAAPTGFPRHSQLSESRLATIDLVSAGPLKLS
jgi:hypothetical protein